jgi:hypothetical protein
LSRRRRERSVAIPSRGERRTQVRAAASGSPYRFAPRNDGSSRASGDLGSVRQAVLRALGPLQAHCVAAGAGASRQ